MARERLWLLGLLVLLGIGWGLTQPLSKIAVSEGYQPLGLVFWQLAIGAGMLCVVTVLRGRTVPLGPRYLRLYALLAVLGTIVPNSASFAAARHLPSGVLSIVLSLVPMVAFPIALSLGMDRFRWGRVAGLLLGLLGVVILARPGALPVTWGWLLVAVIAPCCYALEGNVVARWGTLDLDPLQTLAGMSLVGAILALPLAALTGQWIPPAPPWGAPDVALVLAALIHALVYSAYVWLVGIAGSVFAAQVSYLVTGSGVIWAMVLLKEQYSGEVWVALVFMFAGMSMVQPRSNRNTSRGAVSPGMTRT